MENEGDNLQDNVTVGFEESPNDTNAGENKDSAGDDEKEENP
jgi:hypothetical protein